MKGQTHTSDSVAHHAVLCIGYCEPSPSDLQLQEVVGLLRKTTVLTEGLLDALMGLKLKLFDWILRNL